VSREDQLEAALQQILSVLGPTAPGHLQCPGCRAEWDVALNVCRVALGRESA